MLEIAVKLSAVTLVMVGGLIVAARASRKGGRGGSGISVTGRHGLSKGAVVAVVEVDGRRFLVGAGDNQISMLTELDPAGEVEDEEVTSEAETASTPQGRLGATASRAATFLVAAHRQSRSLQRMDRPTTSTGPRIGPIDRLRAMTVRSHAEQPSREPETPLRPIHAHDPPS